MGSIRVPSSFCGVFGLKATFGLVPRAPGFSPPGWGSLAHTGPMARTVDDAALMLGVMAGHDARDAASLPVATRTYSIEKKRLDGIRVAYSPDLGYAPVAADVRDAIARAVDALADLGACVVPATLAVPPDILKSTLKPIGYTEQATAAMTRTPEQLALSEPEFRAVVAQGLNYRGTDYMAATHRRAALREQFRKLFETCDLLITPTVAVTAFAAGTPGVDEIDGRAVDRHLGWSPFSWPINLAGLPAATVPCGFDRDGLPIGLQIVGKWLGEETILTASAAFEATKPWAQIWPDQRRQDAAQ